MASDKSGRDNSKRKRQSIKTAGLSKNVKLNATRQIQEVVSLSQNLLSSAGLSLSKLRQIEKLTQMEVARRMETTQPAIARLEKGTSLPNLTTIERYIAALRYRGLVVLRDSSLGKDGQVRDGGDVSKVHTVDITELMTALTKWRRRKGLTQTFVAELMDTTQPMVARLERADSPANVRTLERYASAIEVTLELLFEPKR